MKDIAAVVALIAVLAFIGFRGWLRFRRESAQSQLLFEAQKQLLHKLGSTADVSQFLASAGGKEFLDRLKPPPPPPSPKPPSPAEVMFVMQNTDLDARAVAEKAMAIAGTICIYTNANITVEEL